jgi:hypothetical protein
MLTFLVFLGILLLAYATWILAECAVYLRGILIELRQRPAPREMATAQSPWRGAGLS